ncbi:Liver carboxylesterase 1 [Saguinus oedipus]|uniref:Carboxylic ester hydrolase n=1 Tax=Saguinus oedipus TaxID=9490 RepID=A0ABQ9TK77_SAGOE|nr:Liver carboxylesterase 1 [Saguinus oedipus]
MHSLILGLFTTPPRLNLLNLGHAPSPRQALHSAASEPQHVPFLLSALYHFLLLISPYSILPYCKFQLLHDAHSQKALPHILVPGLPYGHFCQDTATSFRLQAGHPSSPPVVDTVHGKVLGKFISLRGFAQPVAVFLGIPFAKPPLGPLRFSPPQPAEPWSFVKNATSYPPMCSQDPTAAQFLSKLFTNREENIPLKLSEDCLYLNIYTPADLTKESRLPVMVWIHGGGLLLGGASTYDGLPLAAYENVVVVMIQYRLGIWGFFSTGDEHSRGNWGHLDQLAALRWVQDNIASFGGNPGSVTIFGQSSGGESVSVLVFSPLAKNLFHRAISESGVALTPGLVEKHDIKPLAEKIATTAGCKTTTSAIMVHCLRQKSEEELLETTLKMSYPYTPTVIDGVVLPKTPEELQAERKFHTVPYIVGFNNKEFGWFLPTLMSFPLSEGKLDQKTAMSLLWRSYPLVVSV